MGPKLCVGLPGLASDVLTVRDTLQFRLKLYKLREKRDISAPAFSHLVSGMLYEKRFSPYFVEPVIAGLTKDNQPYLCATDLIGAPCFAKDFGLAGNSEDNLYGTCESFYKPDLEPDDLFEVLAQCLLAGVDRDAKSGWGGQPSQVLTTPAAMLESISLSTDQ